MPVRQPCGSVSRQSNIPVWSSLDSLGLMRYIPISMHTHTCTRVRTHTHIWSHELYFSGGLVYSLSRKIKQLWFIAFADSCGINSPQLISGCQWFEDWPKSWTVNNQLLEQITLSFIFSSRQLLKLAGIFCLTREASRNTVLYSVHSDLLTQRTKQTAGGSTKREIGRTCPVGCGIFERSWLRINFSLFVSLPFKMI